VNKLASIISCLVILLAVSPPGHAAGLDGLVASLKDGGYVLVFRHGATDDSQKDAYPFKFDDMTAQRQLSERGRNMARELGEALKKLGVPIGEVYTSQLNRAVESGKLLGGKGVAVAGLHEEVHVGSAVAGDPGHQFLEALARVEVLGRAGPRARLEP